MQLRMRPNTIKHSISKFVVGFLAHCFAMLSFVIRSMCPAMEIPCPRPWYAISIERLSYISLYVTSVLKNELPNITQRTHTYNRRNEPVTGIFCPQLRSAAGQPGQPACLWKWTRWTRWTAMKTRNECPDKGGSESGCVFRHRQRPLLSIFRF